MQDDLRKIAARIRRWRDEARLTLQQLADRAGVSPSTIHKIENNQTVPTIAVFLKIAEGLGRSPAELLVEESVEERVLCTRAHRRAAIVDREGTRVEKVVDDLMDPELELWKLVIPPGVGSDLSLVQEDGEMVLLCEQGELTLFIEGHEYVLGPGDAVRSKASIPRGWWNRGSVQVVATFAVTLPRLDARLADKNVRQLIRQHVRPVAKA